jgi:signal transduction histidine kinase
LARGVCVLDLAKHLAPLHAPGPLKMAPTPSQPAATRRPPALPQAPESVQFERLLFELSTGFIAVSPASFDGAIEDALRRIVLFLDIDRSTLSNVSPANGHFHARHSWARPGIEKVERTVSSRTLPWVQQQMRANVPVIFSRLEDLPPEAALDAETYRSIGLRSHVALPLMADGELLAVLGFGVLREERAWPDHFVKRLQLVGDLFASALARRLAQAERDQASGFERLAARILADLLISRSGAEARVIDDALRRIGEFLQIDRVAIWARVPDTCEFNKINRWVSDDSVHAAERLDGGDIPWMCRQLVDAREVAFVRDTELPPEAASDLPTLRKLDLKSALVIPLLVHGDVVGAFSLISTREERPWPPAVASGARLLAQVFANLLAQRAATVQSERDRAALHHMTRVSMLGQLSASIAHQLNQPLAAILGNAEAAQKMLSRDNVDLAELRAICDDIVAEDNRAADVIRRLGALYKRGEMKLVRLDFNALIVETIGLLRSELQTRQVAIVMDLAPALPHIMAGGVQLQQVLLNLILNAADAMGDTPLPRRTLTLVTSHAGEMIELQVCDNGTGIAPQDIGQVFDAFWSTKPGGMGIGLAICQSIAAAHHGRIVAGHGVDGGATFTVTLPVDG